MSVYSSTILADNPIRYHRLSEQGYEASDVSGNAQHGVVANSGVTYGTTGIVPGETDKAMTFDGSTGFVGAPANTFASGNSAWSLETWIKPSGLSGVQCAVAYGSSNTKGAAFLGANGSNAFCGYNGGGVTSSAGLSNGSVYHLVGTWDGTNLKIYVNGSLSGTATPGALSLTLDKGARIGKHIDDSFPFFFPGVIDDVAVYGVALSSTQVSNHYAATSGNYHTVVLGDSPLAYWRLGDSVPANNNIADSSTSNITASIVARGAGTTTGLLTGDVDTAMRFTGTSYISMPSTSLPTGTAAFSLEAWVNIRAAPIANGQFLTIGGASKALLAIDTTGKVIYGLTVSNTLLSSVLSFNVRHHVVMTWDGSTGKAYLDGSLLGTITGSPSNGTNIGTIGADGSGGTNYIGIVDEVAIYSAALSAGQVSTHYSAGTAPTNNLTLSGNVVEVEAVSASIQGVTLAKPLPQYNLWIRNNSTLSFVDVLNDFLELECVLRFNSVSALSVIVNPYSPHTANVLLQSGTDYVNGLILTRDNQDGNGPQLLFSGPIIDIAVDFDASRKPPYSLLITAESDDIVLEDRVCLPVLNYPYSTEVLADSPLRYYRLGEASGTVAADSSASPHNGTYNASGVTYSVAPGIDDSDTAVTLDGSAGKISIPVASLPVVNNAFTVYGWVNWPSLPGVGVNRLIFTMGTSSTNQGITLALTSTGLFCGDFSSTTATYAATAGDWHHVAVKWDGTIMTLYVDGLPRQTLTPGALNITYGGAWIGADLSGANTWLGSIDEVVVIGSALTNARILQLYNVGLNRFAEGPAYDARTGVASTIMQQYVMYNAGALALTERQTANLALAADPLLGGTVDESVRFHNLIEVLANISLRASSEIGFIVRQTMNNSTNNLLFTIFQPRNQQSIAFFSLDIGNLAKFSYQASGVHANVAYSGGSGSGTARPIVHHLHVPSITRSHKHRERFYNDSQYTTTRDLHTQAGAHLTQDKDVIVVGFEAIDTESCAFLRDYHLGDLVSVIIDIPNQPSTTIQDIVRQVTITLKAGQRDIIQPVIGGVGSVHPVSLKHALNKALKVTTAKIDQIQNNQ